MAMLIFISNYLFRFLHFSTYYDFKKLADLLLLGDIRTIQFYVST